MAWLHFEQRQALTRAIVRIDNMRQARLDMSKGVLHTILAGPFDSPFSREQGFALLDQAVVTFEETSRELGVEDAEAAGAFRASIDNFRDRLATWSRSRTAIEETSLRLAIHELEGHTDRLDEGTRQGLRRLSQRLDREFVFAIAAAALLLAGVCVVVLVAGRARDRSEAALRASEERHRVTLMSVGDAVIATDARGNVRLMNPVAERLTGWPIDDATGRPVEEVFHILNEETRDPVENPVHKVLDEGVVVGLANHTVLVSRTGKESPIADSGAPIRDTKGSVTGVVLVFRDQAEERAVMRSLRESELIHRTLVEHLPQRIFIKDRDSVYVSCNSTYAADLHISPEEIRGKDDYAFYPPELADLYRADDRAVMASGTQKDIEERYMIQGTERVIHTIKVPFHDPDGHTVGVLGIFEDITERKRLEETLRSNEALLRIFIEHAPAAIAMFDRSMRYISVSRRWQTDYGLDSQTILGRSHYDVFPEIPERWKEIHRRCLAGATEKCDEDLFTRLDGGATWLRWEIRPWHLADGTVGGITIMSEDITERKQAQEAVRESEEKFRMAFLTSPDAINLNRLSDGFYLDINHGFTSIMGYTREEAIGKTSLELNIWENPADRDRLLQGLSEEGFVQNLEATFRAKGGRLRVGLMSARILNIMGEEVILSITRDITERKSDEMALRKSLEEKVALLKEVHHRVKNNLQIVASLLSLQANRSRAPHVVELLHDTRNRVRSMALLHELLYRSENLAHIQFPAYIGELCNQLLRSCGPDFARIKVETRVDPIDLPLEHAVPCGLIVSELVSNALKHAFPDQRPGRVRVDLHVENEKHLVLCVTDSGIGVPAGFNPASTPTLGLQLVSNLASQLEGSLEVGAPDEGGTFRVVFPIPAGTRIVGES